MISTCTSYPNFRYLNALEAGVTYFSEQIKEREIIRTPQLLKSLLTDPSRKSNGKNSFEHRLHFLSRADFASQSTHANAPYNSGLENKLFTMDNILEQTEFV